MNVYEEDKSEDDDEQGKLRDGMYDSFLLDRKPFNDIAQLTVTAGPKMPLV